MTSAAHQMLGLTLDGGWKVVEKAESRDDHTSAEFSVGYVVEDAKGRRAHCKALDWSSAMEAEDVAEALQYLSNAYIFERDLLDRCRRSKMRRVVHAIADGTVSVPNTKPSRVSYLIFDEADGDSRDVMDETDPADFAVGLALVRDCAVALGQLHRGQVAHQDVKPANLLGWRQTVGWSAKLADLGRAFCEVLEGPHGDHPCPGDTNWAAPEMLYGWPVDRPRTPYDRQMADLFSLGSLLCYVLVRVPYGSMLEMELEVEHRWHAFQGGYAEAQAVLVDAHEHATKRVCEIVHTQIRGEVEELISDMCDPIIETRGRLSRRGGARSAFLLERYISRLDRLAKVHPNRSGLGPR